MDHLGAERVFHQAFVQDHLEKYYFIAFKKREE